MNAIVNGKFFGLLFKKTDKGGYHELRIIQRNDLGVNTEVFPVFDEQVVNALNSYKPDEDITLDVDVYVKNGYLQKKINYVLDLQTGEKIA